MRSSVLIFGGNGFIGTHLSEHFLRRGHQVFVADLNVPGKNPQIEYLFCDVRKPITIELPISPQIVVNLAAVHRTPGHSPEEYFNTNVLGALNVTDWCRKKSVQKLVFTSSIATYGISSEPITENSEQIPISYYGYSKLISEQIHKRWVEDSSTVEASSLIICRPAVIFGTGEKGNFTRLASALRQRRFAYPAGPQIVKGCGYVKDLVRAVDFSLEQNMRIFIFNFAFPKSYTIGEICQSFSKVARFKLPWNLHFITKLMRIAVKSKLRLPGFERIAKLTSSSQIETHALQNSGFDWSYTLDEALEDWKNLSNFDQARDDRELDKN